MPTIRATTTNAEARPCTASSVVARTAALTGARARPKPKPPSTSGTVATQLSSAVSPHSLIHTKPTAAQRHAGGGDDPGGEAAGEVAADHGADRQRDQEPHQHQRGHQLAVGVDRGAGEDRDVDERGDQRGADEEADQHRAPCRRTAERAARGPAAPRRGRRWTHERGGGDRGAEEVPEPLVGEDLDPRVGGGEGEDHAGQGDREQQRAGQVGLAHAAPPAAEVDQRPRAPCAQRTRNSTSGDDRRPARAGSASGRRRRPG